MGVGAPLEGDALFTNFDLERNGLLDGVTYLKELLQSFYILQETDKFSNELKSDISSILQI